MLKNSLDSQKTLLQHRNLVRKKAFLKNLYKDFYMQFKNIPVPQGKLVELGSGAGFIKEIIPITLTTDVISGPDIDKIIRAEKLPFKKDSIASFFMFDVFHHIKNPEKALHEMERCLKRGGKVVMIEPYNSLWGRFIYQLFHHEVFNPEASWKIVGSGRLSDANGALPWIIFVRDREIFEKKFPNLTLIRVTPHTPFRYLLSGGLSFPQLLPGILYPMVLFVEKVLSPFNRIFSMFATIELQKTN